MRMMDLAPLWRSTIGFDRFFDLVEESARWNEESYPPYNIEKTGEDQYAISLAVAGFAPEDITSTTSPSCTCWPARIFAFSTAPTAKPARSYSPAGYMPGISAVSPPIRAQPEISQPRAMPPTTAAAVSTWSLPQAK